MNRASTACRHSCGIGWHRRGSAGGLSLTPTSPRVPCHPGLRPRASTAGRASASPVPAKRCQASQAGGAAASSPVAARTNMFDIFHCFARPLPMGVHSAVAPVQICRRLDNTSQWQEGQHASRRVAGSPAAASRNLVKGLQRL